MGVRRIICWKASPINPQTIWNDVEMSFAICRFVSQVDVAKPSCPATCGACPYSWKATTKELSVAVFFKEPMQISKVFLKQIKNSGVITVSPRIAGCMRTESWVFEDMGREVDVGRILRTVGCHLWCPGARYGTCVVIKLTLCLDDE
jgi:hypothetical protein